MEDMTREQLLEKCNDLVEAIKRKHVQLDAIMIDLPPNKAANDRHQKHKAAWGQKKTRMLMLLSECRPYVGDDLQDAIDYELAHDEFLYQRAMTKSQRRKEIKRAMKNQPQIPTAASE